MSSFNMHVVKVFEYFTRYFNFIKCIIFKTTFYVLPILLGRDILLCWQRLTLTKCFYFSKVKSKTYFLSKLYTK